LLKEDLVKFDIIIKDSQRLKSQNNLLGLYDAGKRLSEIRPLFEGLFPKYKTVFVAQKNQHAQEIARSQSSIKEGTMMSLSIGIGVLIWIYQLVGIWNRSHGIGVIFELVIGGAVMGIVTLLGAAAVGLVCELIVKAINAERKSYVDEEIKEISKNISAAQNMTDPKFWENAIRVDPHA